MMPSLALPALRPRPCQLLPALPSHTLPRMACILSYTLLASCCSELLLDGSSTSTSSASPFCCNRSSKSGTSLCSNGQHVSGNSHQEMSALMLLLGWHASLNWLLIIVEDKVNTISLVASRTVSIVIASVITVLIVDIQAGHTNCLCKFTRASLPTSEPQM